MRPFYLSRNQNGYYRVYFVNQETGTVLTAKSTHVKDKFEATIIATDWYKNGIPEGTTNSRTIESNDSGLQLQSIVERLTFSEAEKLVKMIHEKFNLQSVPMQPQIQVQETISAGQSVVNVNKDIPESPKLCESLYEFWDYDNSEYIKRYLAHGHSMTRNHAKNMVSMVRNYWQPYFGNEITIDELDEEELEDFFFYLKDEREYSDSTVNKTINCATKVFAYLKSKNKIQRNPLENVERFHSNGKKRGLPTETEVKDLLAIDWNNKITKLAFKVSVFCGLRAGEISALQMCDVNIKDDILHIRHNWSVTDGLKVPKNTESRNIPIDHNLAMELYNQGKTNPALSADSFVFFSCVKPEQPYWPSYYQDGFYEALNKIGITEEIRKDRNIVFHSLRHFCATILRQRTDIATVQEILGHKTADMTKHYSDHETQEKLQNIKNIMQMTWNEVLTA